MPYEMSWDVRAVVVRFWGHVSSAEFLEGAHRISVDRRFDDLRFIVNDLSAVEDHALDTPEVQEDLLVLSLGALASNPRIRVVVVSRDSRVQALAGAVRSTHDGQGPKPAVFDSMHSASDWMARQAASFCLRGGRP